MRLRTKQEGQTVLIVLLMTSVILTIGLSVVSRSVTDVRISNQTQESARAFWFAQGQLEEAIRTSAGIPANTSTGGVAYNVVKTDVGGGGSLAFPEKVDEGRIINLWLVDHASNGDFSNTFYQGDSVTVYFGNGGQTLSATSPALEATLIYKGASGGLFYSRRFFYDPYSPRGSGSTLTVTSGSYNVGGKDLAYRGVVNLASASPALPDYGSSGSRKPYVLTLKLLFNTSSQNLAVESSSGTIFNQGSLYTSTATIQSSNISRKVTEFRSWSGVPEVFNYLLYSGGDITAQ